MAKLEKYESIAIRKLLHSVRKIPYAILTREVQRIHFLLGEYTMEEVDMCYQLPVDLLIKLTFRNEKELKEKTLRTYKQILKYNIFHLFRYSRFVCCVERGCPCRIMIPSRGFYTEEKDTDSIQELGRPRLTDPII